MKTQPENRHQQPIKDAIMIDRNPSPTLPRSFLKNKLRFWPRNLALVNGGPSRLQH